MPRPKSSALSEHTLAERLADLLRAAIADGTLKPGQPLRQVELARRLGTSRIPLREALQRLEGEGLVVIHPYRGASVPEVTSAGVDEHREILTHLEAMLYRRVVENLDDETLGRLRELAGSLDPGCEVAFFLDVLRRLHEELYGCARAPLLERLFRTVNNTVLASTRQFLERAEWRLAITEHVRTLVDLFGRGDAAACIEASASFRTRSAAAFEQALREEPRRA